MVKEREELGQVPTARTLPVADPSFVQPAYFLRLDARHVLHQGNGDQSIEHDTVENRQELLQLSVAEQQARPHKRQDKEFNAQFIDFMLHKARGAPVRVSSWLINKTFLTPLSAIF